MGKKKLPPPRMGQQPVTCIILREEHGLRPANINEEKSGLSEEPDEPVRDLDDAMKRVKALMEVIAKSGDKKCAAQVVKWAIDCRTESKRIRDGG